MSKYRISSKIWLRKKYQSCIRTTSSACSQLHVSTHFRQCLGYAVGWDMCERGNVLYYGSVPTEISRGAGPRGSNRALHSGRQSSKWALHYGRQSSKWALHSGRQSSKWALHPGRLPLKWALHPSPRSPEQPHNK